MGTPLWARQALEASGLIDPERDLSTTALQGGVSSEVVLIEAPATGARFVLKRPFERFRVGDPWSVPKRRAALEAQAARLFQAHLAGQVAPLLHFVDDPEAPVLVFQAAEPDWSPWKKELLAGRIRVTLARQAGTLLARLHALSGTLANDTLRDDALFRSQRIGPYLDMAAHRIPKAAPVLDSLAEQFFERDDLVHGDFNPKNLLAGPGDGLWLIDHEVVTRGDAAFDLATLWNHLAVKSLHRPSDAAEYLSCAQAATQAYLESDVGPRPDPVALSRRGLHWLPALLLARMIGKSPAEYLTPVARANGARFAVDRLEDPPHELDAFWRSIPSKQ